VLLVQDGDGEHREKDLLAADAMSVARPEWRRRRVVLGITHVLLCFMTTTTGLTSLSCCDAFQSFDATAKKRCMMRITSPSRLFLVDKPEREDEDDVPMSLLSLFPELSDMKADIQSLMSTKDDKEAILQANRIVNVRKRLLRRMLEMQEEDKPPKEEKGFAPKPKKKKRKSKKKQALPPVVTSLLPPNKEEIDEITQKLPSIADLFPPNSMSKTEETNNGASLPSSSSSSSNRKTTPTMEGVLPVSDLFYRSSQSINEDDKYPSKPSPRGDDEELPFSAEQSDQLTTHHNRIQIRRNQATQQRQTELNTSKTKQNTPRKRRLVRRGIEMLVGGVPINADPPQRCIELHYKYKNPQQTNDWADTITINTPDFGPMLYNYSVSELSDTEKGLYCEYFVNSTLKWNVCPKDLRTIARQFSNQNDGSAGINIFDFDEDSMAAQILKNVDEITGIFRSFVADDSSQALGAMKDMDSMSPQNDDDDDDDNSYLMGELVFSIGVSKEELQSCDAGASDDEKPVFERVLERGIVNSCPDCTGFGVTFTKLLLSDLGDGTTKVIADFNITMSDEETANTRNAAALRKKCQNIHTALAQAMDDGTMQFAMAAAASAEEAWPEELRNRVTEEFLIDEDTDSNDDGYDGTDEFKDAASLFAGLNESELKELKSTVSSMLGDGDFKLMDVKTGDVSTVDSLLADAPYKILGFGDDIENELLTPKRQLSLPSKNDLFFGGENDGVFWNYAESNALKAPYQGRLGLRLVEAVVEKAKHRHPRVIAIGRYKWMLSTGTGRLDGKVASY
jgi:hypothetical protein